MSNITASENEATIDSQPSLETILELREIAVGGAFDMVSAIRKLAAIVISEKAISERIEVNTDASAAAVFATLFNERLAGLLTAAGLDTVEKIRSASDEAILSIEGINAKALASIRAKAG